LLIAARRPYRSKCTASTILTQYFGTYELSEMSEPEAVSQEGEDVHKSVEPTSMTVKSTMRDDIDTDSVKDMGKTVKGPVPKVYPMLELSFK
jgi:hypothetical protein